MATHDKITLEGEHGQYQTTTIALDLMIGRYMPASPNDLQLEVRERHGDPEFRVTTVTEGLMILAELDGHATN